MQNIVSFIIGATVAASVTSLFFIKKQSSEKEELIRLRAESKNYESYVINNITDSATSLMIWDCVYDNFKSIALYKFSRLMIVIGGSFIFASFIFAFFYTLLPF